MESSTSNLVAGRGELLLGTREDGDSAPPVSQKFAAAESKKPPKNGPFLLFVPFVPFCGLNCPTRKLNNFEC
jgi:hypothetical protein